MCKAVFIWVLKELNRAGKAMYSTEVKERSTSIKNGRRVPTAWDLHYYWVKYCRGRWKNKEGWRAVRKNSGTLETDLKTKEKGSLPLQIYCGRRMTKVWSISGWCSGLCWRRSRRSRMAAELQSLGIARKKKAKGEKREGPSDLIYRGESKMAGARIKEPGTAG